MAAGDVKYYGTATIPAGTPGAAGYVDIAEVGMAAADRVLVTPSHTDYQEISVRKRDDITVQVVKTAGTGFRIGSNQKQNPQVIVDYLVIEG